MARADPLYRQPRRRTGGVGPEHPAPCLRRPARPANRIARRHLPSDGQGLAVPDRCRRGPGPVHLCPRLASPQPRAARLGAAHEPCRRTLGECRGPAGVVPHRAERITGAGPARAARLCGAGQHSRRRRYLRLPCARPERRAFLAGRGLGIWQAEPVRALDRARPMDRSRAGAAQPDRVATRRRAGAGRPQAASLNT